MPRKGDVDAKIVREIGLSLTLGAVAAFVVPGRVLGRIDEALIAFLAILAGAALPGMALTAAAQRPPMESAVEARRLGEQLENQVRFWFSFILTGGVAAIVVLVARAMDWQFDTPRPSFIPPFVPDGGAWLVFATVSMTALTAIRMRHVLGAVLGLVRLGTGAHAAQALDRQRDIQESVAEELRRTPIDPHRGEAIHHRERH